MACVGEQFAGRVGMYVIVDSLFAYTGTLFAKFSDNLGRRPLVLDNPLLYAPPQQLRLLIVGSASLLSLISLTLGNRVVITALDRGVTFILAADRRGMNSYFCRYLSWVLALFVPLFCRSTNKWYLCDEFM